MSVRGAGLPALALALTAALAPQAALADQEESFLVVGAVSLAGMLGAADIAFSAYTATMVADGEEPAQSWMIAQTTLAGAQALVLAGATIALTAEDHREEGYEMLAVPFVIWTGGLATFGAWSLAAPFETSTDTRLGASFLGATNLAFTSVGIGALGDERYLPFYASVPQVAIMAPESVLTAVKAANESGERPGWIALSVWSGLLTVHGVINLVGRATSGDPYDRYNSPMPTPEPPPPPPPPPDDPYYIDPESPSPSTPNPPPPPLVVPPPTVVPGTVSGATSVGPGLVFLGTF